MECFYCKCRYEDLLVPVTSQVLVGLQIRADELQVSRIPLEYGARVCKHCCSNWEGYLSIVGLWARFNSTHDPGHPHQHAAVIKKPVPVPKDLSISMPMETSATPFDLQGAEILFMEEEEVYGTVGRYGCAEAGCPFRADSKRLIGHHLMMNHTGHGMTCCGMKFLEREAWLSHYQSHGPPPTVTTLHDALEPTTPKKRKSGRINKVKCPLCSKSLGCASVRNHLANPAIHGLKQAQMSVLRTECGVCGEQFHLTSTNMFKNHCLGKGGVGKE